MLVQSSTIILSTLWAGLAAAAATGSAPIAAGPDRAEPSASTVDTAERLVSTYDAHGNGNGASLAPDFGVTIATLAVKCGNAAGCSIGVEATAQIQPNGGDWAICLLVDGASVSCQFQGISGYQSSFVGGSARGWAAHVDTGPHTVTTQLFAMAAAARYGYFQTEARIYVP